MMRRPGYYIGAITIQEVTGGWVYQLNCDRYEYNFLSLFFHSLLCKIEGYAIGYDVSDRFQVRIPLRIIMKLKRIEASEYTNSDGRFYVRNTYYSNGLPGRSNTTKGWLIEDRSGASPFLVSSTQKSKLRRVDTLTQAREIVAGIIQRDAQAQKLQAAGWYKEDNAKQPGVCWRSPYSGRLLTQTEALLELRLMS